MTFLLAVRKYLRSRNLREEGVLWDYNSREYNRRYGGEDRAAGARGSCSHYIFCLEAGDGQEVRLGYKPLRPTLSGPLPSKGSTTLPNTATSGGPVFRHVSLWETFHV